MGYHLTNYDSFETYYDTLSPPLHQYVIRYDVVFYGTWNIFLFRIELVLFSEQAGGHFHFRYFFVESFYGLPFLKLGYHASFTWIEIYVLAV